MSDYNDNYTWSTPTNDYGFRQNREYNYCTSGYGQGGRYDTGAQDPNARTMLQGSGPSSDSFGAQAGSFEGASMDPAMTLEYDYITEPQDDFDNAHRQYVNECITKMESPVAYRQDTHEEPPRSPRSRAYHRVHNVVNADYPGVRSSSASVSEQRPSRHRSSQYRQGEKGNKHRTKGDKKL